MIFNLAIENAFGQSVAVDKYSVEDSTRILVSNSKFLYQTISNSTMFSLGCVVTPSGRKLWSLHLRIEEYKMTISQGRKFLIKFDDGTVMQLENHTEIGPADYDYKVTSSGTKYSVSPNYVITEDQIMQIIKGNVVKVRIENNTGYIDREMRGFTKKKPSKFPEYLNEMYQNIQQALSSERKITDDF